MKRVTSVSKMRRTPGEVAAQKQARESRTSALRTIGIGVAISVVSAALVGIAIRLFNTGEK